MTHIRITLDTKDTFDTYIDLGIEMARYYFIGRQIDLDEEETTVTIVKIDEIKQTNN